MIDSFSVLIIACCHALFDRLIPQVTARIHSKRYQDIRLHVLVDISRVDPEASLERTADLWVRFTCQMGHNRLQITVTLAGIRPLFAGSEMDFQGFFI